MHTGGQAQIGRVHAAICRLNDLPLGIDPDDFIHEHFHVLLPAEYRSDWSCDLIGRKQARCNLIEHWPEQMVVVFVENGYLNMCISESAGCVQSSESATDDNNVRRLEVRGHNGCLCRLVCASGTTRSLWF